MKFALCLALGLCIGSPAVASAAPGGSIVSAHEGASKKPKKPKKPKMVPVPQPNPCDGR